MTDAPRSDVPTAQGDAPAALGRTVALCTLVAVAVFLEFLVGNKRLLFKDIGADSVNVFLPTLTWWLREAQTGHFWGWSFDAGLGQVLLPYTYGSIFTLPLLLAPLHALPALLAPFEASKLVFAGVFTFLFLRERGAAPWAARVGGVLFMTSGFLGLTSSWPQHSTEGALAALLFFGVERLRRTQRPAWCITAVAALALAQPVFAYANVAMATLYLLWSEADVAHSRGAAARALLRLTLASVLGVLVAAVLVLPTLHVMIASPRGGGGSSAVASLASTAPWTLAGAGQLATAYLRTLGADLTGIGNAYRGWQNMLEGPAFACGAMALVAVPLAWPQLTPRRRRMALVFGALVLAVTALPWLRVTVWLYLGNYYRTLNFAVAVGAIALAVDALEVLRQHGGPSARRALATALVWWSPLALPSVRALLDEGVCMRVALVFAASVALLSLPRRFTAHTAWPAAVLALAALDGVGSVRAGVQSRPALLAEEDREGLFYRDGTAAAVAQLRAQHPEPFRVAKYFSSGPAQYGSINDGMVQGHWGLTSYASFNALGAVRFFVAMDKADLAQEGSTRWLRGLEDAPMLSAFVGARFALVPPQFAARVPAPLQPVADMHGLRVFENPWALPVAFAYSEVLSESAWRTMDTAARQRALFSAAVVDDALAARLQAAGLSPVSLPDVPFDDVARARRGTDARFTVTAPDTFTLHSEGEQARLVFLSVPFDEGFHATVDGVEAEILPVAFGFMGVPVPPGPHVLVLDYRVPGARAGALLSALGLVLALLWVLRTRVRR